MSEFVYVPNEADNTVSVIDTADNSVIATIPVGGDTAAVSPNGAFVYVASESGIVSVIDTASNSVVGTINVGGGAAIVTFSPDGSLAYVTHYGGNYVSVIDTASVSVVGTIPVGSGSYGIAFGRDGTRAYVTNEGSGTVSVIDVASNSVINTITVGSEPTMIAVSPDGTQAYVNNFASGTTSVIDTKSNLVVATITVGSGPYGIAISPDGSHAYVANNGGTVSVIDTASNSVASTINVGGEAVGIAISHAGTHLYVTHYGSSDTVSVVDTTTDTVVGTISVGTLPIYPAILDITTRSVTFSSAVATFTEVTWDASRLIDGDFTGAQGNGWSVFNFDTGSAEAADALLTLASPLPAGHYSLTFTIYQNYWNPGHILGDFALDYTTAASPTLSSPQTPVSILNESSLNGTTFSLLSPSELLADTTNNSLGTDTYTITAFVDSASPITGIFLDAIKNPSLPGGGPGGQYPNGNFVVSELTLDATALFMGVTVTAGQTYNVSSGQTDSGDIVDNGCTLNVLSGGAISATQDSGTLYVSAGGTATDTVVLNSVLLNVYGSATGTIVYGSGLEIVYSGGIAIGTVVNVGAQVVEFGGTELNPTINSSRDQAIYGVASGTVVNSGSNEYVYSGGTAIGTVVNNDNHGGLDVFSGGTAIGTTVNSESVLTVYGFASSSIVNGGGCEFVSGGTAIGTVVESGGQETVQYSGTALGTVVDGNQFVEIGGTVSGAVVNNDGALNVLGTISNTQDYGTVHVSSGGTAIGTVVNYGQEVDSGGIASGTVVNSGGVEVVYGGTANGTILNGTQYVPYGGTASGTVVNNKGVQSVQHATASGTVVNSGGELDLYYSDTVVTNAIVHNGGILGLGGGKVTGTLVMGGTFSGFTVSSGVTFEGSGGTVSKTTVLSGGTLELLAGAKQNGTTISSGGIFEIGSGETLSGYRVSRGITLEAALGGRVSNTTVLSGGTFAVLSGGMANGITVSRGGTATIASGAVVSGAGKVAATGNGATLAVEGDIFTVGSDGVVLGSGAQMDLEVGQVSGTLTIAPGATVNALSGASALLAPSGKSIANSGLIIVENGTTLTLSGTVINSGTLEVSATSSATALNLENAKISGGKLQTNGSNAVIETISGTNVIQGGTIVSGSLVEVTSGTRLSLNGGTIGKGATVETASSGTLVVSGTIINSGTLFARGANSTIAIIGVVKGGTAEVGDGVVDITKASGEAVTFQSGGTGGLVLNDMIAYTGQLSGFGSGGNTSQFVDLTDVNIWSLHPLSYTPANAANTSGTLTVTDGTHSAHIKFVGTYTSASFTAINDGTGGVKITHPPVAQARIDLAQTGFGAHTTLGYSENSSDTGGTLSVKDGIHIAKLALLGNYMATSFVTAADGHGGTLITEAPQTTQQPLLSHPHA